MKAEVTVFLSLVMVLMFAFIGALVESGSIQLAKVYKRGDMDIAMNSVFAEYQKVLLEEYGIFTLDGAYETEQYDSENVLERLEFYGMSDSNLEADRIQLLSDNDGIAFYQQVSYYMKNKYGLDTFTSSLPDKQMWEIQVEQGEEFATKKEENTLRIPETEENIEEESIANILDMDSSQLLELARPEGMSLSKQKIVLSNTVSHRELQTGFGTFVMEKENDAVKGLILSEYGVEQFQNASMTNPLEQTPYIDSPLLYEVEYLLKGKESDYENLKGVVSDLFWIRSANNYLCLMQSPTKQSEAKALALTLATLVTQPELESAFSQVLLIAWACGEGIMDIRNLLSGGEVALMKSEQDWQLGLSGLLTIGTSHHVEVKKEVAGGFSYKDYLRMMLCLENKEDMTMRMLDLIELNMNQVYEAAGFQVDHCVNKLEVTCVSTVQGGYQYEFPTYYEYQ